MKKPFNSLFGTTLGCGFLGVLASFATIPPAVATPLGDFLAERDSLVQSFLALRASIQPLPPAARAATFLQWIASEAPQIAALQRSAAQIAAAAPVPTFPILTEVEIPSNASPVMESFLMASASLQNDWATMANSVRQSPPDVRWAAWQAWQVAHRAALQAQQALGAQVASQAGPPPLPSVPAVPEIPSPQVRLTGYQFGYTYPGLVRSKGPEFDDESQSTDPPTNAWDSFVFVRYITGDREAKAYVDHSLTGAIGCNQTQGGAVVDFVDDQRFGDSHSTEWDWDIQDLESFYNTLMLKFEMNPNP